MGDIRLYELLTEVAICALPPDHSEHRNFALAVRRNSDGSWSVMQGDRHRYNASSGEFDYGSCPDDADRAQWMADHYFTYDRATELARAAAPTITRNGYTVEHVRPWRRDGGSDG